ncbi:MAG: glucokinase [Pseudomonadota bacterium]|nr:glucokinase [Pseudomonadota bacterium]
MRILCGDIGGTNARLALWEGGILQAEETYASAEWPGLEAPLAAWLTRTGVHPDRACFAVAGPVINQRCATTNIPWVVDGAQLRAQLGCPVRIVNDFHAAARGLALLHPGDGVTLFGGEAVLGAPVAVLGAGTGLGEAYVVDDSVIPGEGGHADFGPGDARELRLAAWLFGRNGRASWEDVLSGPGLVNLSRFLCLERGEPPPAWLDGHDAPARVAQEDPEAVAWFCALYGAEAGNMALRVLARGGVYLCGGIAPRMLPALMAGGFRARFEAKGKIAAAIRGVPVTVVTHPGLGLLGAAAEAMRIRD